MVLANQKTKVESGLDYVLMHMDLRTPFGKRELKNLSPFFPGEEEALRSELNRIESCVDFIENAGSLYERLKEIFMEVKDATESIKRSGSYTLSMVELYDIKLLLLQMRAILSITKDKNTGDYKGHHEECVPTEPNSSDSENTNYTFNLPEEYIIEDTEELLDVLDPRKDRMGTFYIYEEFSEKLGKLREKKREIELTIRREQKQERETLRKEQGVNLTPKFDIVLSRSHPDFERISHLPQLEVMTQDYMSVTFMLKPSDTVFGLKGKMEALNIEIEEEEERIRGNLSKKIFSYCDLMIGNCKKIGQLDLCLAKADFAIKRNLVKPEIDAAHIIEYREGRNLVVEESLGKRKLEYQPVSLNLADGVSVITGANMGGKTVSLKLSAQIPILAQHGFFVPAKSAKIGLSNFIQMLIGDSQSLERGLSSFGSEMEELKEILAKATDRSLILVDEIASGTNPIEGTALTKSVIKYLKDRPYISLITTHYEVDTNESNVVNLQVKGLSDCDFGKLNQRIQSADRRERIKIISQYMDYQLYEVDDTSSVPKDAINIATILGLDKEIIEEAKQILKK